jgi:hypothetical protein
MFYSFMSPCIYPKSCSSSNLFRIWSTILRDHYRPQLSELSSTYLSTFYPKDSMRISALSSHSFAEYRSGKPFWHKLACFNLSSTSCSILYDLRLDLANSFNTACCYWSSFVTTSNTFDWAPSCSFETSLQSVCKKVYLLFILFRFYVTLIPSFFNFSIITYF